jgi:hypothetical protein
LQHAQICERSLSTACARRHFGGSMTASHERAPRCQRRLLRGGGGLGRELHVRRAAHSTRHGGTQNT